MAFYPPPLSSLLYEKKSTNGRAVKLLGGCQEPTLHRAFVTLAGNLQRVGSPGCLVARHAHLTARQRQLRP